MLTTKQIKAVRVCCGYSDDFRRKYPAYDREGFHSGYYYHVERFLTENRFSLYGPDVIKLAEQYFPPRKLEVLDDRKRVAEFIAQETLRVLSGKAYRRQ